jgi:hypothetical protein
MSVKRAPLIRARIPYLPIHADDIDRGAASMKVLILPNVGALSDAQAAAIRRFVQRGDRYSQLVRQGFTPSGAMPGPTSCCRISSAVIWPGRP